MPYQGYAYKNVITPNVGATRTMKYDPLGLPPLNLGRTVSQPAAPNNKRRTADNFYKPHLQLYGLPPHMIKSYEKHIH